MHIEGPGKRVTVYVGESDRWEHGTLYEAIVRMLRAEGCAGATVTRGIMGFGKDSRIHTSSILVLSEDLPVTIVFVDTPERVDAVMPRIDAMLSGGLVIVEDVHIHRYSGTDGSAAAV
jgi:PII-like signaling protein